ncbi:MAG: hypothetical protein H6717_13430 [Polyangiaceae bacterium]|nr:hypothetical protein [Polyangiaceae bacterium]
MASRLWLAFPVPFLLVFAACGSSDDAALFNGGGNAGTDAGVGGATGGSGGGVTGGSGGTGAVAGTAGTGATGATGGMAGSGATGGMAGSGATGGMAGAGATGGVAGSGATGGVGGTGGEPPIGCTGHCGSSDPVPNSNPACYCDSICVNNGDCCADYGTVCNTTTPNSVGCGGSDCDQSNSYCCQEWSNQTQSYTPVCRAQNQNCYGVNVECDGPEDCGSGQVCCGQLAGTGNYYTVFECRNPGQCAQSAGGRIVCGGSPQVCPTGLTCAPSSFLPEYNVCRTVN